jgi:hypothetical protein
MTEFVAFLFIKKNKVLLAVGKNGPSVTETGVVPKGAIIQKDVRGQKMNEMEHALHRLLYASSKGTLIPLQYEFVKVCNDREHDALVYVYFIYAWDGVEPVSFIGQQETSLHLRYLPIDEAIATVASEVDRIILVTAKETIRIRSVLHGRLYS